MPMSAAIIEDGAVLVRTRRGALALTGDDVPLSGGFRQLLRLIDGKRSQAEVRRAMAQLDEEDFVLWTGELMRQGLIAAKDEVPVDELAFQWTAELPVSAFRTPSPETTAMIDDIMADVTKTIGPAADPQTEKRLATTGRMAAIESVRSHASVGQAGFFVYPDAADGLPEVPHVCIAGHLPAQNKVLALQLARSGAQTSVVASREAMRAALGGSAKPDILMVDAEMPTLDAFRTLDAMRMDAEMRGVRMVILSSRGERADLAQAMMLGATAYIVKPLRKDVLEAALPQILGRPLARG
ncbi:MAG: response regulator [Burkholderiales bacterium]|nr:response regulator [Burkholderiales bacterium]